MGDAFTPIMFLVVLIWSVIPKNLWRPKWYGEGKLGGFRIFVVEHPPPWPLYPCFLWFRPSTFSGSLLYVKWRPEDFELSSFLSSSHTLSLILRAFVFQFYRGRSKTPGLSKLGQGHKVNTHGSQDSNPGLSDFKVWARGPFIIPEVPTEMAELSGSWGLRKMINSDRCKFTTVW